LPPRTQDLIGIGFVEIRWMFIERNSHSNIKIAICMEVPSPRVDKTIN
jgi:hypothetical protein